MARLRAQDMTQGVPVRPLGMTRDVVTAWDRHESELSDRCVSGLTTERPRITKPEKGPRKAMLVYFAEYARESLSQAPAYASGGCFSRRSQLAVVRIGISKPSRIQGQVRS